MNKTPPKNISDSKAIASITGAGVGTLIITIAQNLPDTLSWKKWLIIIAPSAAVVTNALMSWVKNKLNRFLNEKEMKNLYNSTKNQLETAISNPNTSAKHKKNLLIKLEELEMKWVNVNFERIGRIEKIVLFDTKPVINTRLNNAKTNET